MQIWIYFTTMLKSTQGDSMLSPSWKRRSRQRKRFYASTPSVSSFVCLSVCLSPKYVHKIATFSNTKQFRAICLCWQPMGSSTWGFQRTHCLTPKMQDGEHAALKIVKSYHISTKFHSILMKYGTQQLIWKSMRVTWPNMKIFKIQDIGW